MGSAPPLTADPVGTAAALARLAVDRDAEAWGLLVEAHGGDMYRAAFRVTGDGELAADACQEAFLRIRASAARFHPLGDNPEAAAKAWILRVTVTSALQLLRARRRRHHHETAVALRSQTSADGPVEGDAPSPAVVEALRRELTELPESHRVPLLLHLQAGLDYRAIAGEVGCSEGNARVRVHRALTRLRKRLAATGALVSVAAIEGSLGAAEPVPVPELTAGWKALLVSAQSPTLPPAVVFGGAGIAAKAAIAAALVAALSVTVAAYAGRASAVAAAPPAVATLSEPAPPAPTVETPPPTPAAAARAGVVVGAVVSVDAQRGRFELRDRDTGAIDTYATPWIGKNPAEGGHQDRDILERVRALTVGGSVTVRWETGERFRDAVAITPLP
jgi:RNA polymerase sigma-70 factor (ECF subfamily)